MQRRGAVTQIVRRTVRVGQLRLVGEIQDSVTWNLCLWRQSAWRWRMPWHMLVLLPEEVEMCVFLGTGVGFWRGLV